MPGQPESIEARGCEISGHHGSMDYHVPAQDGGKARVDAAEYQAIVLTKILKALDELVRFQQAQASIQRLQSDMLRHATAPLTNPDRG